jgi:hypothetical protein
MGELSASGLVDYFLITGGIGKDSGDLKELGIPESHYLGVKALESSLPASKIHLEDKATNGSENARYGMATIIADGLPHSALTVVAHATSNRRLAQQLADETAKAGQHVDTIYRVPTDYAFDPSNPADRAEALAEFGRFIDWPAKGWMSSQPDLPTDLVDFALDQRQHNQ